MNSIKSPFLIHIILLISFCSLCSKDLMAQITFINSTGKTVKVTGLPNPVCGSKYGKLEGKVKPGSRNPPRLTQYFPPVDNVPLAEYVHLKASTTYSLKFEVSPKTVVLEDTARGELRLIRNTNFEGLGFFTIHQSEKHVQVVKRSETANSIIYEAIAVEFLNGTEKGSISLSYRDGEFIESVIIPVFVEGITDEEVPITDTTVQPKMPFMVLHPPPGDGSFSELLQNKTICRGLEDTYATAQSNDVHATVKIGIAGSAGFIVTTNFEFSVAFSAGFKIESSQVGTTNTQTCITNTSSYTTREKDVFIGYGTDLVLGVYKYLSLDPQTCKPKFEERLISAPVGTVREFAMTKDEILLEMDSLYRVVADSGTIHDDMNLRRKKIRTINNAQNQLDVWRQVLQLNETNISDPQNKVQKNFTIFAPKSRTEKTAVTVVESKAITYEQFIEGRAGLEAIVEIAGSGISGGAEFSSSRRFGATESNSSEITEEISYTLTDDDEGDVIDMDILYDAMFGSPIFRIRPESSKTSCPYEGGAQRDNPQIKVPNSSADSMVVTGVRVGGDAIFKFQVCNNSNENRNFILSLDEKTNSELNAKVTLATRNFEDMKPGCTNVEVIINQIIKSRFNYPRLKLNFRPECPEEGEISSSIYLSAYFDPTTRADESLLYTSLAIFPNPAGGQTTVDLALAQSQPIRLQVIDLLGRVIYAPEPVVTDHLHQMIPTTSFSEGVYIIHIKTPVGSVNKKLFVKK